MAQRFVAQRCAGEEICSPQGLNSPPRIQRSLYRPRERCRIFSDRICQDDLGHHHEEDKICKEQEVRSSAQQLPRCKNLPVAAP